MTRILIVLVTTVLLTSCSGVHVRSDWDQAVDFTRFDSFALIEESAPSINPLVDGRIRTALVETLLSRDMEKVESVDEADLAIGFLVATETRRSFRTVYSGWRSRGYRHSRRGFRGGAGTASTTTRTRVYTVGELIIAVFDAESNELVWEGSGVRRVDRSGGPEQSERRIQDAVSQILRGFPPGGE
jgi:hypothetical protein